MTGSEDTSVIVWDIKTQVVKTRLWYVTMFLLIIPDITFQTDLASPEILWLGNKPKCQYLHIITLLHRPGSLRLFSFCRHASPVAVGNLLLFHPTDESISSRVFACDLLMDKKLPARKTDFRLDCWRWWSIFFHRYEQHHKIMFSNVHFTPTTGHFYQVFCFRLHMCVCVYATARCFNILPRATCERKPEMSFITEQ